MRRPSTTSGACSTTARPVGPASPSTNSYRRLVPGYEAPVNAFFSVGNRSAAVRIPRYATDPKEARFEFRPPDATCNVYLALAAQLVAGIDGMLREIDPNRGGVRPHRRRHLLLERRRTGQISPLPSSLKEALDALDEDHGFLLVDEVFTEDLLERWIAFKMEQEYYEVRNRPHPYEMELYFDA